MTFPSRARSDHVGGSSGDNQSETDHSHPTTLRDTPPGVYGDSHGGESGKGDDDGTRQLITQTEGDTTVVCQPQTDDAPDPSR